MIFPRNLSLLINKYNFVIEINDSLAFIVSGIILNDKEISLLI